MIWFFAQINLDPEDKKMNRQIEYLDRFFGQDEKGISDIRGVMIRAFNSESVSYQGRSTSSRDFQKSLGYSLEKVSSVITQIGIDCPLSAGLQEKLNTLDLRIFFDLRIKLGKILPEEWEAGERGPLRDNYEEIIRLYRIFRDAFVRENPDSR